MEYNLHFLKCPNHSLALGILKYSYILTVLFITYFQFKYQHNFAAFSDFQVNIYIQTLNYLNEEVSLLCFKLIIYFAFHITSYAP